MSNSQNQEFGHVKFVTDTKRLAEDRLTYLNLLCSMILDFQIAERNITVDSSLLRLPEIGILNARASAFRSTRSRAMAEGSEHLLLFFCLDGAANLTQLGREVTIRTGESILLSSSDALIMDRSASRHITLTLPKAGLRPLTTDLDAALMKPLDNTSQHLHLLRGYLDLLAEQQAVADFGLQTLAAGHVTNLAALAIGATRDAGERAKDNSLRVARLHAIKRDIGQNLVLGDVSPDALARRHGISPRYIRKLLASEGTTLSEFVLEQRLALVHQRLNDPRFAHSTIGGLAFDAGFGDLSTFNHAFRRHYGMTPSDVRVLAANRVATGGFRALVA
jgi:AraC-like DNA-binding protein